MRLRRGALAGRQTRKAGAAAPLQKAGMAASVTGSAGSPPWVAAGGSASSWSSPTNQAGGAAVILGSPLTERSLVATSDAKGLGRRADPRAAQIVGGGGGATTSLRQAVGTSQVDEAPHAAGDRPRRA
jgi:hypothetical protein